MHDEPHEHEHDVDADHADEAHDHVDLRGASRYRSIGIDVGSSTSHFVVSDLYVGKRDPLLAGKPEVLRRKTVYQSPILFTPFQDGIIDVDSLEHFLLHECAHAGFRLEDMDTGALICTGEAARKRNAAAISERLSRRSGRFVCAVAGHHLEAVLGVYGSGAVNASFRVSSNLVALDIGGGTAKRTLIRDGKVLHTAALNVGTRLIAWDEDQRVTRLEEAGAAIARAAGVELRIGDRLEDSAIDAIAERMAASLIQYLGLHPMDALSRQLLLTESLPPALTEDTRFIFTGGLSEYFYGRETQPLGDIGYVLSDEFRHQLLHQVSEDRVLPLNNGIRATVIGAGQFTVQISSETVWLDSRWELPLRNVPVYTIPVDWQDLQPSRVQEMLSNVLARVGEEPVCGLFFGSAPFYGYGIMHQLADALAEGLRALEWERPLVLVFGQNVARAVGNALATRIPGLPVLAVDEIEVGDLEYLDIGAPAANEDYLPVVVKTLVFA